MSAPIPRNTVHVLTRIKGNLEPIGATLKDINAAALSLTGLTMKFRMVLVSDGTVKVNNAAAVADADQTANKGKVTYSPVAADMNTVGQYAAYYVADAAVERLFPYDGATFLIRVIEETAA